VPANPKSTPFVETLKREGVPDSFRSVTTHPIPKTVRSIPQIAMMLIFSLRKRNPSIAAIGGASDIISSPRRGPKRWSALK